MTQSFGTLIMVVVAGAAGLGCSLEDDAPAAGGVAGSYGLALQSDDGAGPIRARVDIVSDGDGRLRGWLFARALYSLEMDVRVEADSVALHSQQGGQTVDLSLERDASARIGGDVHGTEHAEADDYEFTRELSGTVGPDDAPPDVVTSAEDTLHDEVDLMPWHSVALDLTEPITREAFDAIVLPGEIALAPLGPEPWVDRLLLTLSDWSAGFAGLVTVDVRDPSGNASGPRSLSLEYAGIGEALGAVDFEASSPSLVWGDVDLGGAAHCESGACASIAWEASSGCYDAAGFAFALVPGTTTMRVRWRVFVSSPTTEGEVAAVIPLVFDAPSAASDETPFSTPKVQLLEAAPGAPEPWASDWSEVALVLHEPADRAAFRAQLGGCAEPGLGLPARAVLVVERVSTE